MCLRNVRLTRMIDRIGPKTGEIRTDERIARASLCRAELAVAPGDRIPFGELMIYAKRKSQRRLVIDSGRLLRLAEIRANGLGGGQMVEVENLLRGRIGDL